MSVINSMELDCSICQDVICNLALLDSNCFRQHFFCYECIVNYCKTHQCCPECLEEVTTIFKFDRVAGKTTEEFIVTTEHEVETCSGVGAGLQDDL